MTEKHKSYTEITDKHPGLKGVISENSWNFIGKSDKLTRSHLLKSWKQNIRKNIDSKRYRRHGSLSRDCLGFGKNKCIVAIGAGPSLNKNKHILKQIHDIDGLKHPDERDFIFIASNHMFKPLLLEGIIPDFVMIADASDVIMGQLTEDIPESGRNCILIAGLHCSPKVLKKWEKQGRDIRFYLTASLDEEYEKLTQKNPINVNMAQGGNVINSAWSVGVKFFKAPVFMALGNDLSYPLEKTKEKRRESYYADGDYSTNIATKRDEAKSTQTWAGYTQERSNVITFNSLNRYNYELDLVGTTQTLWVYKTWIEAQIIANAKRQDLKYKYYNCSEGGISGVMCKELEPKGDVGIENWYFLDEICPKWRTWMFEDAIEVFLRAKKELNSAWIKPAAHNVIDTAHLN